MISRFLPHCTCKDTGISKSPTSRASKVRGTFLPVEYELAKFISDVENPHESWSTATPACEWDGVKCNDVGEVNSIVWNGRTMCGTLHWDCIPRSVTNLELSANQLSGCVCFASLHQDVERMLLQNNRFIGELRLGDLPPRMRILNVSQNQFSGFVDLSCLQQTGITGFDITGNPNLEGSIPRGIVPKGCWWGYPSSWVQK